MTDLRTCSPSTVKDLCAQFHGYGGAGGSATYSFAVYEDGVPVAAFAWQPPPPGAAKSVCPEFPQGVLALSRMVAVPREHRRLKHISKPLRRQMRALIDRTRWPVLVTYHDEGQGHTGHVYKCSGWERGEARRTPYYVDAAGKRVSSYANGKTLGARGDVRRGGKTTIVRWEHWVCRRGDAATWSRQAGWVREPIRGKTWASGSQAYRFTRSLPTSPPAPEEAK